MAITPGWGQSWETLANAINAYYGGGPQGAQYQQVVQMLNSGEYTVEEMESILGNIPEFERTYNNAGELTGVSYKAQSTIATAGGSQAQAINSNAIGSSTSQFNSVQTITKDAQTGKATISDNVTKYNNGTAGTTKAIASSAILGITAAAVGIKVGKTVNQIAYDNGWNWLEWAGVPIESLDPNAWKTITNGEQGDNFLESANLALFDMLFTIDDSTKNPQAYVDENTFAYITAFMAQAGCFDTTKIPYPGSVGSRITINNMWQMTAGQFMARYIPGEAHSDFSIYQLASNFFDGSYQDYISYADPGVISANKDHVYWIGVEDDEQEVYVSSIDGEVYHTSTPFITKKMIYAYSNGSTLPTSFSYNDQTTNNWDFLDVTEYPVQAPSTESGILVGQINEGSVPGITDQVGVPVFDPSQISDLTDIEEVKQALQSQYPELWENRIVTSPDGETEHVYIPVGFPTGGVGIYPTTENARANKLAPDISGNGENATDELVKTLIEMFQYPYTRPGMQTDTDVPTEPAEPGNPTGTGTTPTLVIPEGSAEALYSIYNPSQAQLNSFGGWLWSSSFVDQILKIFNDPMQAIIGLHKVFATPSTSGTGPIKVGYLSSGVSAKLVNKQYTSVDCGSISLKEYFKNSLDYTDTDVYIYLPFIGIMPLNVKDVMRSTISVQYKVDVLTGACLAIINVTRDMSAGGQLYCYSGNCAVQYPLSSGSYMGILSGALGIAASAASTILSGGAALPLALGVGAGALTKMQTNVAHSGSISGNAGAMGIKKPYLILRRPQTKIASDYKKMAGISNNENVPLNSCSGFTKVKHVNVKDIPATNTELTEIDRLLHEGVLI